MVHSRFTRTVDVRLMRAILRVVRSLASLILSFFLSLRLFAHEAGRVTPSLQ